MAVQNMNINMDIMRLNPYHVTQFDNGFVLDNRHISTIYDTKPATKTYLVSPNFPNLLFLP